MREEKHFPKTLHILFYYLILCSVASPGRQAGPVLPPCATGAVRLGTQRAPFYCFRLFLIKGSPMHELGNSQI